MILQTCYFGYFGHVLRSTYKILAQTCIKLYVYLHEKYQIHHSFLSEETMKVMLTCRHSADIMVKPLIKQEAVTCEFLMRKTKSFTFKMILESKAKKLDNKQ